MGEKESRQTTCCLPPMAGTPSGKAKSSHVPMAAKEPRQMERIHAPLAQEKSRPCPRGNAQKMAQGQERPT
jgi:hypothetical protein